MKGKVVIEAYDQILKYFPIESQTSPSDKGFLLASVALMRTLNKSYSYAEIGSYLGGSLTPFLMDPHCSSVLSIDERGRQQPDERGAKFDYAGITNQTMIDKLEKNGINTEKLKTFDGSIDSLSPSEQTFDLAFIDGEHTDFACFRDFLWLLPIMKSDALVMFHDSSLIYKALRLIQLYLRKMEIPFRFMKITDSEMSGIFLGKYSIMDLSELFGSEDNPDAFYISAETHILGQLVANRVEVVFSVKINPPKIIGFQR